MTARSAHNWPDAVPAALSRAPFAGSLRIQPLQAAASRWFKVVDVPLDRPLTDAVVVLESLATIPRFTVEMPLSELTRPYRLIHAVLQRTCPEYRPRAALALLDSSVPIRVVMSNGQPTRPEELLELRGVAPDGARSSVRIRMDWIAENWRKHIGKHMESDRDLALWQGIIAAQCLPIRAPDFKAAVRAARRAAPGPASLGELKPEQWPLIEAYAAMTVGAFSELLVNQTVHVGRADAVPGAAIRGMAGVLHMAADAFGIEPGSEQLVTFTASQLLAVARDNSGPDRPLRWRSTYPAPAAAQSEKLAQLRAFAARSEQFDFVAWP